MQACVLHRRLVLPVMFTRWARLRVQPARYLTAWLQRMCSASIFLRSTLLQAEVKRAELEQQRDALQQRRQLLAATMQERNRLHDVKQRDLEQHDMYVQLQRLEQQIRTLNQVSTGGMCFLKLSSKYRAATFVPPQASRVCRLQLTAVC